MTAACHVILVCAEAGRAGRKQHDALARQRIARLVHGVFDIRCSVQCEPRVARGRHFAALAGFDPEAISAIPGLGIA